jgi:hypothetical protein
MTPPPITTSLLGMFGRDRAPVEETTYFSSMGMTLPGRGDGSLPVAMMIFLALIFSLPPWLRSTSISLLEANLPYPLM